MWTGRRLVRKRPRLSNARIVKFWEIHQGLAEKGFRAGRIEPASRTGIRFPQTLRSRPLSDMEPYVLD